MPQVIAHFLIPAFIVSIIRDFYLKKGGRKKFPLHYVLIAGIGGILPDIDIAVSVLLNFIGVEGWNIHKTFTHSLFFPLIFLLLFFILRPVNLKAKICNLTRHKLRLSTIFLMLFIGIVIHILLDALFGSGAFLINPVGGFEDNMDYGIDLISYLPEKLQEWSMPILDGVLFLIWIIYLELKHKISDFI